MDSKVITGQIEKEYSAKEPVLMQYLAAVRSLEKQFKGFTLQNIERNKNEEADTLAKATAKGEALPSDVFYHVIGTPAVKNPEGLQITEGLELLREIHNGTCRSHSGPRALAAKVIRQGFYWPAVICTTNQVTRSCEACQKFSPRTCFATHQAHCPHLVASAVGA